MTTKQKLFDDLESNVFKLDIFHCYIDSLLHINLKLLKINQDRNVKYLWTGRHIWNNKGDPAELYDNEEVLVSQYY